MLQRRFFFPMNSAMLRFIALTFWLSVFGAQAGVVIGGTRFIYSASMDALAVPVNNTSDASWLINSHVQPASRWPGAVIQAPNSVPFIITPPLFLLRAKQESRLRVVYSGQGLPGDRESLFTLSIAAIPSGKAESNSVQLAFRQSMKLIYRPANLAGDPQQSYQQLHWVLGAEGLEVRNPTPYYVTLFLLHTNEKTIDAAGVVAPFAVRKTHWCRGALTCHVRWQSINDYGRVMPPLTQDLHYSR